MLTNPCNSKSARPEKSFAPGVKVALTRRVSPSIGECQLTYMSRQPISYHKAVEQHRAYAQALSDMGFHVVSLAPEPDLPDAVFVEDSAIVLNELAILGATALPSRALELASVREFLAVHREVHSLGHGARFEGGDVVRQERKLYVGQSSRTCRVAIQRLQKILRPHGYGVKSVSVFGCLHLSTGASFLGKNVVLANPDWVDANAFEDCEVLAVPKDEPWAANTLAVNGMVLMPEGFPRTRALLEQRGFNVRATDISEFMKAEAGITCLTNILEVSRNMLDFNLPQPADDGVRVF